MMSGAGPFGPMEMGGMFTTVKVRDDLKAGDYADPGWYRHPPGTVAREWQGSTPEAVRAQASPADDAPPSEDTALRVKKPTGHSSAPHRPSTHQPGNRHP